jgi:hypothetical protein
LHISCAEFHPNRTINVESMRRYIFIIQQHARQYNLNRYSVTLTCVGAVSPS